MTTTARQERLDDIAEGIVCTYSKQPRYKGFTVAEAYAMAEEALAKEEMIAHDLAKYEAFLSEKAATAEMVAK